jgi:aminopeptidase-like protein
MKTSEKATADRRAVPDSSAIGAEMHGFVRELYPICRSITGDGLRETLRRIGERIHLAVTEVPTGTPVFDWTVPREWNIRDAYVKDAAGEKIADFRESNLHVVNYSVPVHTTMPLAELKEHLFALPAHAQWVPYVTSYYNDTWGFCLSYERLLELQNGEYEVVIDSSLQDGALTYGECFLPGETSEEVLISAHACHPSLCNDNLSGIAVAVFLAGMLHDAPLRYSYRFLFAPGTIGAITWLALNESRLSNIKGGFVLACVGDPSPCTYKKSRRGTTEIDRAFAQVLRHAGAPHRIEEFSPSGFDERQFCSPGLDLPVGCFMRAGSGYAENHTSADNLDLVRPAALAESLIRCLAAIDVLEDNKTYLNIVPKCEPQLGKRGLYRSFGGRAATRGEEDAMRWVLNFSDSRTSLLDIAERSRISFEALRSAAEALLKAGLLDATC